MSKLSKYSRVIAQPQSNYAIDNFVDGGQLTPERRFRQAVLETDTSKASVDEARYDVIRLQIKLDAIRKKFKDKKGSKVSSDRLRKAKADIMSKRLVRAETSLQGRERDYARHLLNVDKYEKELGLIGDETEDELYQMLQNSEARHYVTKLALDTAAHIISRNGGPSEGVLLALHQLPKQDLEDFKGTLSSMMDLVSKNEYIEALHDQSSHSLLPPTPKIEEK